MIKIKYNNKNTFEEVSFSKYNNVVTMTPTTPDANGFTTWKLDGVTQLGDFSDFTTVYKVDGDSVSYSNDGSIYVEPPKPTEEELKKTGSTIRESHFRNMVKGSRLHRYKDSYRKSNC